MSVAVRLPDDGIRLPEEGIRPTVALGPPRQGREGFDGGAGATIGRVRRDGATPSPAQVAAVLGQLEELRLLVSRLRAALEHPQPDGGKVASLREEAPARRRARAPLARTALGAAVGLLLVVLFVRLVDLGGAIRALSRLRPGFALLCGVAFLSAYVVRSVRWRCLLSPTEVGIGRLAAIYQVATFLNWMLPVQAGELAKSLLLRRSDGVPVSRSLATVSIDRSMDLLPAIALIGAAPFVGLHLSRPLWVVLVLASSAVALALVAVAIAARLRRRPSRRVQGLLAAAVPAGARERIEPPVGAFLDTLLALARRRSALLAAVALTAVAVCLDALFCLLAFRAVGVHLSPQVALYGYTLFNLAFILPTPPGHIGSNEVVGLLIFAGVFGIGRSQVAAMFLFAHPWTAILITTSGLVCLSRLGLRFRTALGFATGRTAEARP